MGQRNHVGMATEMKTSNIDEMQQKMVLPRVGYMSHFECVIV